MNHFAESSLSPEILQGIAELGFTQPTKIQSLAIPYILTDRRDLIALAQTGTGKTAAFSLPVLDMIDRSSNQIQFLILAPTRELCLQITKDIRTYAKYMDNLRIQAVYGGSSVPEQLKALRKEPQIVVGTPGRVIDFIKRGALDFSFVHWLVLDEADEMLSMGFKEELETILHETPDYKQTLLFSATMNPDIERIAQKYFKTPQKVSAGKINEVRKSITHEYYMVRGSQKKEALKRIIDLYPGRYAIIFCRTRRETQEVADYLMQQGYAADALHGDMSQSQRDTVMKRFRLKNIDLLVATDVAARGLDVDSLTHVIHYTLPDDSEIFVHRSGRTGRAGKEGLAISLVKPEESRRLKHIIQDAHLEIKQREIPTGEEIMTAQANGVLSNLLSEEPEEGASFDLESLPDLSAFSKEELVNKLLHYHLREMGLYYQKHKDLSSGSSHHYERDDFESDSGRRRDRRKKNKNMTRFFFNLGKKDKLRKKDILDIVNQSTRKSKRSPDIGEIEILEKFSFFEVEKDYKKEILRNINDGVFKGRAMRVEIAN